MALRTILFEGEEVLRKTSRPVTDFGPRTAALLDDMIETLIESGGVGLAAPQVGILRRAVLVMRGDEILELLNPEIISTEGEQTGSEGCLSVPGKRGTVTRPMKLVVRAQNRHGEWYDSECEELAARCVCHELDHLDGILYIDKATDIVEYDEDEEYEDYEEE